MTPEEIEEKIAYLGGLLEVDRTYDQHLRLETLVQLRATLRELDAARAVVERVKAAMALSQAEYERSHPATQAAAIHARDVSMFRSILAAKPEATEQGKCDKCGSHEQLVMVGHAQLCHACYDKMTKPSPDLAAMRGATRGLQISALALDRGRAYCQVCCRSV